MHGNASTYPTHSILKSPCRRKPLAQGSFQQSIQSLSITKKNSQQRNTSIIKSQCFNNPFTYANHNSIFSIRDKVEKIAHIQHLQNIRIVSSGRNPSFLYIGHSIVHIVVVVFLWETQLKDITGMKINYGYFLTL